MKGHVKVRIVEFADDGMLVARGYGNRIRYYWLPNGATYTPVDPEWREADWIEEGCELWVVPEYLLAKEA